MYRTYFYKEEFDEYNKGYERVEENDMPIMYSDKKNFVNKYLYPTLQQAKCRFKNIEYRLYRKGEYFTEAIVMFNDYEDNGVWFFVSKDSEMGIMFDVMRNIL